MNEDILIKCEICEKLFNPGILKEAYPYGFTAICDDCFNKSLINDDFRSQFTFSF